MTRAAITGVGAVTPLGVGADALYGGWTAGTSGIVDGEGACRDFVVTDHLTIGAPVAVFSSTSGGGSSHLVHRNTTGQDGAIVIDPSTAPHYLLFSFSTQTF